MVSDPQGLTPLRGHLQAGDAGDDHRYARQAERRGQRIVITPRGREMRKRMWPVYARAIHEAVGRRVTEREATTLAGLLGKLAE